MNSYDTVWYSMIPNPPKVSCVCARQMAPTCSDTHDFSRSPGTKTIAWVAWTNQTVGQVLICRRFVDFITFRDERLVHCFDVPFLCRYSVGIRLSWFPSMMKNVSKAARSPPLSVLPDQINQIADWHVTSGSFLIFSDLFWSLCDCLSFRCFRFKHLCRAWQSSCQVSMERSGALQGPE